MPRIAPKACPFVENAEGWNCLTGTERAGHKYMMTTPEDWPLGVGLPLKRTGNGTLQTAVLMRDQVNADPIKIVTRPLGAEESRTLEYENWEDLLDDGWRVD